LRRSQCEFKSRSIRGNVEVSLSRSSSIGSSGDEGQVEVKLRTESEFNNTTLFSRMKKYQRIGFIIVSFPKILEFILAFSMTSLKYF